MGGLISFLYGLLSYGAALVALLYLIGFSGNLFVQKSIDVGTPAPLATALVVNALLLALFGIQHSVMARRTFKRWWTSLVPAAVERSTYVLSTSIVLGLLCWQWIPVTAPQVWRVDNPLASSLLWAAFWLGWALVLLSTFLINHFELFGLQQVFARLMRRDIRPPGFRTPLIYRYVRHPIYLGVLLSLWAVPVMSAGHLMYSIGLSAYIFVGIWFEERDLIAQFGERYRRYRAEVGMVLPWRRRT